MKTIIMAVGVLLLVGGAFVGGSIDPLGLRKMTAGGAAEAHEEPTPSEIATLNYTTKERVVNLADQRYLKTEVVIEVGFEGKEAKELANLKGEEMKKKQDELVFEMSPAYPALSDAITTLISSKKSSDVLTPEGKATLREQLKLKLEPLMRGRKIAAVYLAQFIIQ